MTEESPVAPHPIIDILHEAIAKIGAFEHEAAVYLVAELHALVAKVKAGL